MKTCRECRHRVSEQAIACPGCGAPYPAREQWDGYGFEYKSQSTFLGLPLLPKTHTPTSSLPLLQTEKIPPAEAAALSDCPYSLVGQLPNPCRTTRPDQ